jgi:hypothetical protein
MTIKKGEPWGLPGPLPAGGLLVRSDAEARQAVTDAVEAGQAPPALGLLGGDLARTVGATGDLRRFEAGETVQLPVDLGVAHLDGARHHFVAHAVARRSWWRGRCVAAMNAEWLGRWDVAPRSHPNDGLLDVVDGDPGFDDRLKVRARLPTGAHLPHPALTVTRAAVVDLRFDRPLDIWLDGEHIGRATALRLEVVPDALVCVV